MIDGALDKKFMDIAINLANLHLGRTRANPSVGCVIALDGKILASSVTNIGGRPHAEAIAIDYLLERGVSGLDKATLYVTLEPCSHFGQTPPCVNKIIEAGVGRVVIGCLDPDSRVCGRGAAGLTDAGVEVFLMKDGDCEALYRSYFYNKKTGLPYLVAKLACTLNGKIFSIDERLISSLESRLYTNFLRSRFDGIIVGHNTYSNDRPGLDCRVDGLEKFSPKKIILSDCRGGGESFSDGDINLIKCDLSHGEIRDVLRGLYDKSGISRVMVEGGARVFSAFLGSGALNEIIIVYSKKIFENSALDMYVGDFAIDIDKYYLDNTKILVNDVICTYVLRENA